MLERVVCTYCVYKLCCKTTFPPIFYSPGLRAVSTDESENSRNTNRIFNGMKSSQIIIIIIVII